MPPLRQHLGAGQASRAGFSLVEMLVSLALFSIVLSMVFAFLDQAGRKLETEANGVQTHQGARVAMDELGLLVQQAGFGIERRDPGNPASWQRAVIHAGPHALAFNANLDDAVGAIGPEVTLTFPDGSSYAGEADDETTEGAETYYYTLDANDDGQISAADRWASAAGSYNPAGSTENPLDYALFRRVYGFDGEQSGGQPVALTPYLFTNATATDDYGDGTSPEPLFTYWLGEDLNGDDQLADAECVIEPCPPSSPRRPRTYLWGDSDFDGELNESEKDALRSFPVGDPGWWPNPLASNGRFHDTHLSEDIVPGATVLEVDDADGFAAGQFVEFGSAGLVERAVLVAVDTSGFSDTLTLGTAIRWPHDRSDPVRVLPTTLLQAIRTVELTFGAIRPERDFNAALGAPAPGHSARVGTRGLDYRVVSFERRFGLPNLRTRPAGAE
jgi:prepilin-type N-terminal cleavage/methylation domain-containing protein